eukprot:CAMPEP_0206431042 /NCGR_PEP_ID=MMETSP0324_2-20121206/7149_1 /ASSEMBLY_ACC=CAM_ASM_000836 /TAXON_ID=2866 /ORGANISM="Crypthecodinium cohnii, Strain Seligo" /LENGTH=107 /DNA_ID=CAMNT_0053896935 /DNA_START=251 /DNA_END=574 /DNA_ORIENTATION=-
MAVVQKLKPALQRLRSRGALADEVALLDVVTMAKSGSCLAQAGCDSSRGVGGLQPNISRPELKFILIFVQDFSHELNFASLCSHTAMVKASQLPAILKLRTSFLCQG